MSRFRPGRPDLNPATSPSPIRSPGRPPTTLTLSAAGAIAINATITASSGGLTLTAGSGQAVTATGAINVGTFNLTQGAWSQNTANLPSFYAANFTIGASASFLRAAGGAGTTGSPYLLKDIYGVQGVGTSIDLSRQFLFADQRH